jgi:hypothetical protein
MGIQPEDDTTIAPDTSFGEPLFGPHDGLPDPVAK